MLHGIHSQNGCKFATDFALLEQQWDQFVNHLAWLGFKKIQFNWCASRPLYRTEQRIGKFLRSPFDNHFTLAYIRSTAIYLMLFISARNIQCSMFIRRAHSGMISPTLYLLEIETETMTRYDPIQAWLNALKCHYVKYDSITNNLFARVYRYSLNTIAHLSTMNACNHCTLPSYHFVSWNPHSVIDCRKFITHVFEK